MFATLVNGFRILARFIVFCIFQNDFREAQDAVEWRA